MPSCSKARVTVKSTMMVRISVARYEVKRVGIDGCSSAARRELAATNPKKDKITRGKQSWQEEKESGNIFLNRRQCEHLHSKQKEAQPTPPRTQPAHNSLDEGRASLIQQSVVPALSASRSNFTTRRIPRRRL